MVENSAELQGSPMTVPVSAEYFDAPRNDAIDRIARRRAATYWITAIGLVLVCIPVLTLEWQGGVQLHTNMEIVATILALIVGILALVRYYTKKNSAILFIGTAFLGTAFLDGYHALVTSEYFVSAFPSKLPSLIPWSWIASRLFLSILLCLSWVAWWYEEKHSAGRNFREVSVYAAVAILTLTSFLFFAFVSLPRAYYPELFLHRPEELVPAILFLIALVGYLRKGQWKHDGFEHWLILCLIIGATSEMAVMSFSSQIFDLEFDVAHLLKILSYACILSGLLINIHEIFRQEQHRELALRAAEARILQSRDRLETMVNHLPCGVCVLDSNLTIIATNKLFYDLIALPSEKFPASSNYEDAMKFLAEQNRHLSGDIESLLARRLAKTRKFEAEHFEQLQPDGKTLEIHSFPVLRQGLVRTYMDITERKRAEQDILNSQTRLKAIVDTAHDAIITGDMNGTIQSFNPAAEDIFGWKESEAVGQSLGILHADEDESHEIRSLRKQFQQSGNNDFLKKRFELTGIRKNGKTFPMTLAIAATNVDGATLLTGIIRDITEEKMAQQATIAAKEQAEHTNRAKSEFLANMSHELRTPLNAIIGFSEVMKTQTFGPIGDRKYQDYATGIYESGTHLLGIINDILDIAKIESGKIALHEEDVDVPVIIQTAQILLKERAELGGVQLRHDIAEDLPWLLADKRSVKQIILNLLSNAVKFTPVGGMVTTKVWCNINSSYTVQIVDTGIGIEPSDIPKVLAPFVQVDSGLHRKFEGTGLGLPLTKSLTELHGGSLNIQSEVGVGTTVTVRFPSHRISLQVNAQSSNAS